MLTPLLLSPEPLSDPRLESVLGSGSGVVLDALVDPVALGLESVKLSCCKSLLAVADLC